MTLATSTKCVLLLHLVAVTQAVQKHDIQNVMAELSSDGEVVHRLNADKEHSKERLDICNSNFLKGKENTNVCANPKLKQQPIHEMAMCMEASFQLGVGFAGRIPRSEWNLRPKGCFAAPCGGKLLEDHGESEGRRRRRHRKSDSNKEAKPQEKQCYFYNPFGSVPSKPVGTPICNRPQFLRGKSDSNGICPKGYEAIMDEEKCREATTCLGNCGESHFRIDVDKGNEHPQGCFIHKETGCTAFNPAGKGAPTNKGAARVLKGTPLCSVR